MRRRLRLNMLPLRRQSSIAPKGILMAGGIPRQMEATRANELEEQVVPSSFNAGGYKAVGESGPIGAMPAVYAAVVDAVSHLGVNELSLPITPHALWRALRE